TRTPPSCAHRDSATGRSSTSPSRPACATISADRCSPSRFPSTMTRCCLPIWLRRCAPGLSAGEAEEAPRRLAPERLPPARCQRPRARSQPSEGALLTAGSTQKPSTHTPAAASVSISCRDGGAEGADGSVTGTCFSAIPRCYALQEAPAPPPQIRAEPGTDGQPA